MIFNLKRKDKNTKKSVTEDNNLSGSITDSLYKQNIDITSKNKSLSILRKLYEISILTLSQSELAVKVCKVIQEDLEFEMVGVLVGGTKKDLFNPLSFSSSRRLMNVQTELGIDFNKLPLSPQSGELVKAVIENKASLHSQELDEVWGEEINKSDYKALGSEGHFDTVIVSPLIIEDKTIGISIFGINREYSKLSDHEIESISNLNNVIAVAIDRSVLYGKLTLTNKELEEANERLKILDTQKSEFVSLASHQLRGPLTAINGYVGMILGGEYGKISKSVDEALSKVQIASKDLSVLVGDYLDVTRIELGRMKYQFEDISLVQIAKEVVDEMEPVVSKKGLEFDTDLSEEPLMVNADRNKLKQVMLNLVDNAVKYTPKGSIIVSVKKINEKANFTITDTGIGISSEVLPTIFGKFVRAPGANRINVGGAGLGLFIGKKIMTEHKGRIWVGSPGEDKGSSFSFELDLK